MRFFSSSSAMILAVMFLLLSVNAHIMMTHPVPYGKSSLNNSPLVADGSDFPCKQRQGVYDDQGASNSAAIGDEVPLSFTGSAVHGGGSCQISLTTDKAPTKNTQWFVIHSYEGGCPAKNMEGNAPDGTQGTNNYTFKIPPGVAPGSYTLAWTWFNRIGNREMYMNCAPFTVTGGSTGTGSNATAASMKRRIEAAKEAERMVKRQSSGFPAMYVANACGGCTTPDDNKNLQFPDPGANTDILVSNSGNNAMELLELPTCSCNGPVTGASSSGSSVSSAGASAAAVAPSSASQQAPAGQATASAAVSTPVGTATGLVDPDAGMGASTAAAAPAVTSDAASVASAPAASSAVPLASTPSADASTPASTVAAPASAASGSASGSNGSSTGSSTGGSQSCTGSSLVCSSDGTMFGICDTNGQAVMRPVAAGTTCTNGAIAAKSGAGSS